MSRNPIVTQSDKHCMSLPWAKLHILNLLCHLFSPDGGVREVLVGPDGPEDVARLQAGRRARGPGRQRHVLQRH